MHSMLNVVFCDDDALFRERTVETVRRLFERHDIDLRCGQAASSDELLAAMGTGSFDLIFLDIDMPGMDGIRLGEELRAHGCGADIIYLSNMDDKVYEIFRVHPWSFVRKSRLEEELPGVIDEYVGSLRRRGNSFMATGADGQIYSIVPEELVYIEAAGKNQKAVSVRQKEPVVLRGSMQTLDDELTGSGFIRIHKGFLVNYRYIKKITSRSVLLDTGDDLPVGRDRLNAARERYLSLMKWKGLSR